MWNLLEDVSLFNRPAGDDGEYDAHVHLAQMVSLLGEPPEALIRRERFYRKHDLRRPIINPRGKECKSMNEFWGGPFFDDASRFFSEPWHERGLELGLIFVTDQILRRDLVVGRKLADTITVMDGAEKDEFLDFVSGMLQWLPEKRKTAAELLQHPMFDALNKSHDEYYS